jgi:hypothetical protein
MSSVSTTPVYGKHFVHITSCSFRLFTQTSRSQISRSLASCSLASASLASCLLASRSLASCSLVFHSLVFHLLVFHSLASRSPASCSQTVILFTSCSRRPLCGDLDSNSQIPSSTDPSLVDNLFADILFVNFYLARLLFLRPDHSAGTLTVCTYFSSTELSLADILFADTFFAGFSLADLFLVSIGDYSHVLHFSILE